MLPNLYDAKRSDVNKKGQIGEKSLGKEKGKGGGCWNCGGTGHMAAQCPTPKGRGKGTRKGEGKGWSGKASHKGKT